MQNSPYFVNDYLDTDQQPVVITMCGDITLHPVVGEAGEGEGTAGSHIETWTVERLDDTAAEGPANVWSVEVS